MKKLSREEILSILGLGSDPVHSLLWYMKNNSDLHNIIHEYIMKELNKEEMFPLEAKKLKVQERCIKFPWLVIKKNASDIRVLIHDTDHAVVSSEHIFNNIPKAIKFFINQTYCTSGAIKNFLS